MGVDSSVNKSQPGTQISEIEAYLETTLRPVVPRKVFIEDLRHRLEEIQPEPASAISIMQLTVVVLAVGVGGMLLFFSLVRIMVSIIRTIRDRGAIE